MKEQSQFPPYLLYRGIGLMLRRQVHFPKSRVGEIVNDEEDYEIFRQVFVNRSGGQPEEPPAIFKVSFHFKSFSFKVNKILSLLPIPFIIAQHGFRSKTWMRGKKTGKFQGAYEWDSESDAENYWNSFPMRLMKKRAAPDSLKHSIT